MRKMRAVVRFVEEELEEDIYNEESLSAMEDDDSINPLDQAFMFGYLSS